MEDLPSSRITKSRLFERVGVDFAGPLVTKCHHLKKATQYKSYLCLFICTETRAVHLELEFSMSMEAFLTALRRFIARRGHPTDILSDNGSNFLDGKVLVQLKHQFWSRWTRDVLHHLQARWKWHQHRPPLSVGDLVLIQTDNMPPLSWPLACILEIIPGTNGIPRVVLLRSPSGPAKRAINRVISLPMPTCRVPEDGDSPERQ
ncbi:hypothetical protein HNY73_006438 [Argiope bruennichi]|uniref:DUF5641 domain-containing protein n=1 Tax=Argiope bruennichi TaxID=94029 RepID=A0A8T0FKX2_ARGBR|nr:hypothetical protein HNY73_006438 [Argiope bruennichi]